jgi:hypothetical protein
VKDIFIHKIIECILILYLLLAPALEAKAFWGAKYEPPDGQVYHCAQAEVRPASFTKLEVDWQGVEDYAEACQRRPKLIMHYITFDTLGYALLKSRIEKITAQKYDYMLQIGLDFYSYFPRYSSFRPTDITKRIADGDYDGKIRELARLFVRIKSPVFLRPGYEFGGNGQGQHASKEHWVKAWRRIHDIFKNEGAQNVAFVWNTLDAHDYLDYYPGDGYVDWWGINVFINDADRDTFIGQFIREAAKHKKPVMIAESTPRYIGSVGGETAWMNWYAPYFNLLSKYPHIKAFCYINASWKNYPDRTFAFDCRIQSNTYVNDRYRQKMSSGIFINANPQ